MYGAIFIIISCFCNPPGMFSFIRPLSKMNKNGTLRMLNLDASIGLASTFNLPTRTFPLASDANSSMIGATATQVVHHGAQANRSTGRGDFSTLFSKLLSVIITGCGSNSSSVFSKAPHFPHLPPASILSAGILFFAPQSVQRILTASPGAVFFRLVGKRAWHLPHLAAAPILSAGIRLAAPQSEQ